MTDNYIYCWRHQKVVSVTYGNMNAQFTFYSEMAKSNIDTQVYKGVFQLLARHAIHFSIVVILVAKLVFLYSMYMLCNISWDDIQYSLCLILLLFYDIKLCLNKNISSFILWISTQHICIELNERKNGMATDISIVVLWFEEITILKCNPRKSLKIPNI